MESDRFRMASPQVVADLVDGELVAVNLETGTYFAMYSASAQVWGTLAAGCAISQILEVLDECQATSIIRPSDLLLFTENLLDHGLIEYTNDAGDEAVDALTSLRGHSEWVPLRVHVHADLQDILLLDPVHDTNASGWPEAK
jgi:hypothetical protein